MANALPTESCRMTGEQGDHDPNILMADASSLVITMACSMHTGPRYSRPKAIVLSAALVASHSLLSQPG